MTSQQMKQECEKSEIEYYVDQFTLDRGVMIISWPKVVTQTEYDDIEAYLGIFQRRLRKMVIKEGDGQ